MAPVVQSITEKHWLHLHQFQCWAVFFLQHPVRFAVHLRIAEHSSDPDWAMLGESPFETDNDSIDLDIDEYFDLEHTLQPGANCWFHSTSPDESEGHLHQDGTVIDDKEDGAKDLPSIEIEHGRIIFAWITVNKEVIVWCFDFFLG
jgi:hypothetical protein